MALRFCHAKVATVTALRAMSMSAPHKYLYHASLVTTNAFGGKPSISFQYAGRPYSPGMRFSTLSHVDEKTGAPTMVDVSAKSVSARTAVASARIWLPDNVMKLLDTDGEMRSAKGPVFATAIIAGTMACKRTHELIPFCHPLALESCKFRIVNAGKNEISIEATASISGKTGVEMEALTAVRYSASCAQS